MLANKSQPKKNKGWGFSRTNMKKTTNEQNLNNVSNKIGIIIVLDYNLKKKVVSMSPMDINK